MKKGIIWFFVFLMCVGFVFATYIVINNPYHDYKFQYVNDPATINTNSSSFSNQTTWFLGFNSIDDFYYKVLSKWQNISGRPTHLSNLTDDIVYSSKNVNSSNYWDGNDIPSDLNYDILLNWQNISGRITHLSNLTDDIVYSTKNVNSSDFWDGLDTPANLQNKVLSSWVNISGRITHQSNLTDDTVYSIKNVNSSNYWDGNDVPSDLNNRITLSQVNVTDEDWLEETTAASTYVNRTLWTSIDNYPSACAANNFVTTIGDSLTCAQPGAAAITAGTFGSGNYVMDQNLTVQGLVLEKDVGHVIFDNSTCIILKGDTSTLYIC